MKLHPLKIELIFLTTTPNNFTNLATEETNYKTEKFEIPTRGSSNFK